MPQTVWMSSSSSSSSSQSHSNLRVPQPHAHTKTDRCSEAASSRPREASFSEKQASYLNICCKDNNTNLLLAMVSLIRVVGFQFPNRTRSFRRRKRQAWPCCPASYNHNCSSGHVRSLLNRHALFSVRTCLKYKPPISVS